jgi:hypothetical protein
MQSHLPVKLQPSKFREMQLDTHKTMPAEDHGRQATQKTMDGLKIPAARNQSRSPIKSPTSSLQKKILEEADKTIKSTFRPKPEHRHVVAMATQHKQLIANSGWSELNHLDATLEKLEAKQRKETKQQAQGEELHCTMRGSARTGTLPAAHTLVACGSSTWTLCSAAVGAGLPFCTCY